MTRSGSEPLLSSVQDLVREVRALAVCEHERFERDVWQRLADAAVPGVATTPSYHNERHVSAVCDCIEAVFDGQGAGEDPFGLSADASRWASISGDPVPAVHVLRAAFGVALACHDLGNIAISERVANGSGRLGLDLARIYDSSALYATPAVEVRSAAIARALLFSRGGELGRSPSFVRLVEHLVLQTVFHFEKVSDDAPFWSAMQVVDMIGSYFFLSVPRLEAIAGLFAEMRVQKPGSIPVLPFLTSLEERFDRLLPDPAVRETVLSLFERNEHGRTRESVFAVPARFRPMSVPVPYAEAIAALLAPA